ncbi:MAG: acetyl-CoA carboxylase biotin carboxyl carrier protein subunit [Bacteriovorax sp.]|jgi:3-methylcrotonyl-CoA carboxylase alpha subunit|nr:acetyl-CoA carboxylase biotin carboxyl carrier protein subunit [Bacteriovorax sp.]
MKKQFVIDDEIVDVEVVDESASFVLFNFEGEEYSVNLGALQDGKMVLNMKGKNRPVILADTHYVVDGQEFVIDAPRRSRKKIKSVDHGQMKSPMPGKILKILVKVGDEVVAGTPILVMEAMKMEHTIKASKAGTVLQIHFKEGDQVAGGVELVNVK